DSQSMIFRARTFIKRQRPLHVAIAAGVSIVVLALAFGWVPGQRNGVAQNSATTDAANRSSGATVVDKQPGTSEPHDATAPSVSSPNPEKASTADQRGQIETPPWEITWLKKHGEPHTTRNGMDAFNLRPNDAGAINYAIELEIVQIVDEDC